MGTKNLIRIVLCLAIIAGYFLPWLTLSAFDIVRYSTEMSSDSETERTGQIVWYASALIPLFALICLIQSVSNRAPGGFVRSLPFIVTALLVALLFIGSTKDSETDASGFLSMVGIGLYVTLAASFLLMLVGRDRMAHRVATPGNTATM